MPIKQKLDPDVNETVESFKRSTSHYYGEKPERPLGLNILIAVVILFFVICCLWLLKLEYRDTFYIQTSAQKACPKDHIAVWESVYTMECVKAR